LDTKEEYNPTDSINNTQQISVPPVPESTRNNTNNENTVAAKIPNMQNQADATISGTVNNGVNNWDNSHTTSVTKGSQPVPTNINQFQQETYCQRKYLGFSKKKFLFIGVPTITVVTILLVFGIINGQMTKNYARFIRETWDTKSEEIDTGYISFSDPEGLRDKAQKIVDVSAETITIFEEKGAPYKAKSVREKTIAYFKSINEIGLEATKYAEVAIKYRKISDSLDGVSSAPSMTDPAAAIATLKSLQHTLDNSKNELRAVSVPDNMVKMHEGYIKAVGLLSDALGKLTIGYEKSDISSINAAISDYNSALKSINNAIKEGNKVSEEIVNRYNKENRRTNEIQNHIEDFVNQYQNKILVY